MKRFRIEVWVLGILAETHETDSLKQAQKIYWAHNNLLDRWTKLYIDGKTGSKEWMDSTIGGGNTLNYAISTMSAEARARVARKKGRSK